MRRFFLENEKNEGDEVQVAGAEARHIARVLRVRPGRALCFFDAAGNRYRARVLATSPDAVTLEIEDKQKPGPAPMVKIDVAQAMLRSGKMDDLVRAMTELGVHRWFPFFSQRTVPRPDFGRMAEKIARWEKIARESLKQCERTRAPEIGPALAFSELVESVSAYDVSIVFYESQRAPFKALRDQGPAPESVLLVIGPEGGFEKEEAQSLIDAGAVAAGLGPRILRAGTAAIAACALAQYLAGDMGPLPAQDV